MSEKLFKRLDVIGGWVAFLIAAIVYMLTLEPTVSFWDCGEFISAANKIQVGHPPGAPFFMLVARFFALFASDVTQIAYMVNTFSAMASAFTIMFLYWSIAYFAKRMIAPDKNYSVGKTIAIMGCSMIGALVYTFSDTFWFSAVEAEVYAFSSFFTAIVFWAILKWSEIDNDRVASRWLLLIALLTGMAIGVHLLNLLTLPAIAFVVYYKKFKPSAKGFIITAIISLLIISVLMWGIIPGVGIVASKLELFFVNQIGLPYNFGMIVWVILTIVTLCLSIYFTQYSEHKVLKIIFPILSLILIGAPFISGNVFFNILIVAAMSFGVYYLVKKNKNSLLNLIMTAFTMVMIGYSSYAIIMIRSNANPPMDQNSPDDVFSFVSYLNREQYGDRPLLYGEYFVEDNRYPTDIVETSPIYVARNGRYEIVNYRTKAVYDNKDHTIFPRMYSDDAQHIEIYKDFGGFKRSQRKPDFSNNLKFFFDYQLGWMYWRYFMWNFAGRQNDIQGNGNNMYGNWISGLDFVDNARLGDQDNLPDYLKENKGLNKYYMLPLLLGLLGFGFQFLKNRKDWWVVSLLFVLTGIAIVVYLNQTPNQPRERDYSYAGSFYAFSIWVGLGVASIYSLLKKFSPLAVASGIATLICLPVPYIMAKENWDDHDRSNRYVAHDVGYNYLMSCEPNAILFTYADNDTFPVWFAQEVENIRPDVKICCLSYFVSDWYIDQMKTKAFDADPIPLKITRDKYEPTIRDYIIHRPSYMRQTEDRGYISVDSLVNYMVDDRVSYFDDRYFYPKNKYYVKANAEELIANGIINIEDADKVEETMRLDINKTSIDKSSMMLLDMFRNNNWKRPIYYTSMSGSNSIGMHDYFHNQGSAYQLVPIKNNPYSDIDTEKMYDNYMNKYKWGNMGDPNVYIDHTITNITKILRIRDNFSKLSINLCKNGDFDRARAVMNRCDSIMPLKAFPPGHSDVTYALGWYALEEFEKGDDYIRGILNSASQTIDYLLEREKSKMNRNKAEIAIALYTYHKTLYVINNGEREELFSEFLPEFLQYRELFKTIFGHDFEDAI